MIRPDILSKYVNHQNATIAAKAQRLFNDLILCRDIDKNCVSCGSRSAKRNAGHYYSETKHPFLRFNPNNVHAQCIKCNHYEGRDMAIGGAYYQELVQRIGAKEIRRMDAQKNGKLHRYEMILALEKAKADHLELKQALKHIWSAEKVPGTFPTSNHAAAQKILTNTWLTVPQLKKKYEGLGKLG